MRQKVIVPQCVANWIRQNDHIEDPIEEIIDDYRCGDILNRDVESWYELNKETFYRAILDGYEVEGVRYTVVMPSGDGLVKNIKRNIVFLDDAYDFLLDGYTHLLTEEEIKSKGGNYWQYARRVDNVHC